MAGLEEENIRLKETIKALTSENDEIKGKYECLKSTNDDVLKRLSIIEERSRSTSPPPADQSKKQKSTKVIPPRQSSTFQNGGAVSPYHSTPVLYEVEELRRCVLASNASITHLQDRWSKAATQLDDHDERLADHDQNSRKNSLFIKGLLDIPNKVYGLEFSKYVLRKLHEMLPAIADNLD